MKKSFWRISMALSLVILLFAGCGVDEYDEELLIGSWSATDGYNYLFLEDHTGNSTDSNGKGLSFDWSLSYDELELKFKGSGESAKIGYQTFVIESLSQKKMEAYDKNDPNEEIIIFTR